MPSSIYVPYSKHKLKTYQTHIKSLFRSSHVNICRNIERSKQREHYSTLKITDNTCERNKVAKIETKDYIHRHLILQTEK